MEENQSQNGRAKKFFTSKIFKWILIILLEFVSVMLFTKLQTNNPDVFKNKGFMIYWGICFLLSIFTLMRINSYIKKNQNTGTPGVVRIISERQHREEQQEKFAGRFAVMAVLSFVLAPFIAPFNLGTLIHKSVCFAVR